MSAIGRRLAGLALACAATTLASGCGRGAPFHLAPRAAPSATRPPGKTPWWSPAPAARMVLESRPLGFDPDGSARWLVLVRFFDAHRHATRLLSGGNLDYYASAGTAQWQTRARFGAPSAIVTSFTDGPLTIRVHATSPAGLPDARLQTDTRAWRFPRVVVKALGPHLVQGGWFPPEPSGGVRIVRSQKGRARMVALSATDSSMFRDASVRPGATYRYTVVRPSNHEASMLVDVPAALQSARLSVTGKGMYLTFSPSTLDDDAYSTLDPQAIVERARWAGIRYIELRTAYGEYWEVTPEARPTIDALIDGAAAQGIAVIGWTVPRRASFADLAQSVATASYRTRRGTPLAGLAIDLERGEEYLGSGGGARAAMTEYSRLLREALGPAYPIVAIVEDPYLERLTNRDVPYAEIAETSSALQPMTYWRMLTKVDGHGQATGRLIRASLAAVRREGGERVAIVVGGQTADLGGFGAPSAEEISVSMAESRKSGALGISFFDWNGTGASQWAAVARYRW